MTFELSGQFETLTGLEAAGAADSSYSVTDRVSLISLRVPHIATVRYFLEVALVTAMTHPRTQYLEEAQDPARQPLLRNDASQQEEAATQSGAEQPVSGGKAVESGAPSAPPLGDSSASATQSNLIEAQNAVVATYGLPVGYQTHYAGTAPPVLRRHVLRSTL